MRKNLFMVLIVLSGMVSISANAFQDRYVSYDNFTRISAKHERARHWAICAAIYEAAAGVHEKLLDQAAEGKKMRELSNGAKAAVAMTFVSGMDLNTEGQIERFKSTWEFARLMAVTMPATVATAIEADLSKATDEQSRMNAIKAIFETVPICMGNLELQQALIDFWRELAMSGLITIPTE